MAKEFQVVAQLLLAGEHPTTINLRAKVTAYAKSPCITHITSLQKASSGSHSECSSNTPFSNSPFPNLQSPIPFPLHSQGGLG